MLSSRVQVLSSRVQVLSSGSSEPGVRDQPAEAREDIGGVLGACDGDLTLGEILGAVAGAQYAAEGGVDLDRAPEAALLAHHDVGRIFCAGRPDCLLDHILGELPGVVE